MKPPPATSRRAVGSATVVGIGLLLGLLLVGAAAWAAKEVPFLAGRVNDLAQMVPAAARDRIEAKLRDLESRTGAQVAVLTIDSLDGEPLEDYSVRVAQTWKLGRKGVDDGVLLLVAKQERKMRIEVGYGLESKLTDLASRRILDEVVRPRFRQGDYGAGIEAGVDAIVATVEGKPLPSAPPAARSLTAGFGSVAATLMAGALFTVVVGIFSLVAVVTPGSAGWFLYLFLMPFYAAFPTAFFPPYGGVFACAAWILAFPLLRRWVSPGSKDFSKRHPGLAGFAASAGHPGSGGGWSGGGFSSGGGSSGGGGSFGGGGASSSW